MLYSPTISRIRLWLQQEIGKYPASFSALAEYFSPLPERGEGREASCVQFGRISMAGVSGEGFSPQHRGYQQID
jgi:hypothetical protein